MPCGEIRIEPAFLLMDQQQCTDKKFQRTFFNKLIKLLVNSQLLHLLEEDYIYTLIDCSIRVSVKNNNTRTPSHLLKRFHYMYKNILTQILKGLNTKVRLTLPLPQSTIPSGLEDWEESFTFDNWNSTYLA